MKVKLISVVFIVFFLAGLVGATDEGLVARWTFDEGQGNISYDSAGTNNGTIYGAQWVGGKVGGALSLDGIDDYVEVPDSATLRPHYITMSAWIKTQKRYESILTKGRNLDAYYEQYSFGVFSDGKGQSDIKRNSGGKPGVGWQVCSGGTILDNDKWNLVTATWDGSVMKIFVNGQLDGVNSSAVPGFIDDYAGGTLRIGMHWSQDPAWFSGTIDDVRIYDRALSPEEVQQLYNIPEPATILLLGLGVPILSGLRMKR